MLLFFNKSVGFSIRLAIFCCCITEHRIFESFSISFVDFSCGVADNSHKFVSSTVLAIGVASFRPSAVDSAMVLSVAVLSSTEVFVDRTEGFTSCSVM